MSRHIRHLIFWLVAICSLLSCSNDEDFSISKDEALNYGNHSDLEQIDSFGATGPYKAVGSAELNPGASSRFVYVLVDGEKIKKEYALDESQSIVAEFFENRSGDGFAVVYRRNTQEHLD